MLPFIPSPIEFDYDSLFRAVINKSGRMQYYHVRKGEKQQRISKNKFSEIYNNSNIIAIKPIQDPAGGCPIQFEVYTKSGELEASPS
jgi:hypothetical protein